MAGAVRQQPAIPTAVTDREKKDLRNSHSTTHKIRRLCKLFSSEPSQPLFLGLQSTFPRSASNIFETNIPPRNCHQIRLFIPCQVICISHSDSLSGSLPPDTQPPTVETMENSHVIADVHQL
ncbi:unnamed protein product [Allacma fusca]|uniref:Uncharacterized protein n=1 Tax=Allacma fusca TaxID=39272 RepID=A0A8J2LKJ2_9HEXA|nr:unnamed protein product [Allacma fusca]